MGALGQDVVTLRPDDQLLLMQGGVEKRLKVQAVIDYINSMAMAEQPAIPNPTPAANVTVLGVSVATGASATNQQNTIVAILTALRNAGIIAS